MIEAEYGPAGEILRFAADYEQHCQGAVPALFGSVRYNSSVSRARRVSVGHASVLEGDTGTRNLAFPIWLSEPGAGPVTVDFLPTGGTAVPGSDYSGQAGSIALSAGSVESSIPVPVFGDVMDETDEVLYVHLTAAAGASAELAVDGVGTILNDDPPPQLAVEDAGVLEGNPGSPGQWASFTVRLSSPSGKVVSMAYATEPDSAEEGADFAGTTGVLEIAPGAAFGTVTVPVVADLEPEPDETFQLLLASPSNSTISDGVGTATILDDESPLSFYTVPPCRLLDTRQSGPLLAANSGRRVEAAGSCEVPATARAVAVGVTSVGPTDSGHLKLYAAGAAPPNTSVLNFTSGQTRTGNTVVVVGAAGGLSLRCVMPVGSPGGTHVVVDVFGYFE